jgi:hypothetical protein
MADEKGWYAVRCVFDGRVIAEARGLPEGAHTYEERITLWNAGSFDEAVALAEAEARDYEGDLSVYVGLAQAFQLFEPPGHGAEIFSLMRDSTLDPGAYLDAFFDTGGEHQGEIPSDL